MRKTATVIIQTTGGDTRKATELLMGSQSVAGSSKFIFFVSLYELPQPPYYGLTTTVRLFMDGSEVNSAFQISQGYGWGEFAGLAEGTHEFYAVFDGNIEYKPSQSNVVTHTVLSGGILVGTALWYFIPIPQATITVGGKTFKTDYQGKFTVNLTRGTYTLTLTHPLFELYTREVLVEAETEITVQPTMKLWVKAVAVAVPAVTGLAVALRRQLLYPRKR